MARTQRNLSLEIGGRRLSPAPWLLELARVAARVGGNVGAVALRAKLASLGIGGDVIGLVETELNREGLIRRRHQHAQPCGRPRHRLATLLDRLNQLASLVGLVHAPSVDVRPGHGHVGVTQRLRYQ